MLNGAFDKRLKTIIYTLNRQSALGETIESFLKLIGELYLFDKVSLKLSTFDRNLSSDWYRQDDLGDGNLSSMLTLPMRTEHLNGMLEMFQISKSRNWGETEYRDLEIAVEVFLSTVERIYGQGESQPRGQSFCSDFDRARATYQRLLEYGNTIIIRVSPDFILNDVVGSCEGLLGVSPERLLQSRSSIWTRIIHKDDGARMRQRMMAIRHIPVEFIEEFRVINQQTGEHKKLIGRGVPIFAADGELVGWEGIGLDVTELQEAKQEIYSQKMRIEALFEVARALQMNLDPSMVALKGLRALVKATSSNSGLAFVYNSNNNFLELVAAEGVGQPYLEEVQRLINGPSLVRYAVERKEGILIDNIQEDPRAVVKVAKVEGLMATIVMPLMIGEVVLGAIVIFRKNKTSYSTADFELVSAAANQIALATRQAELYASEKKQAGYFSALYRLSHELSRHLDSKEIAQHAFQILNKELSCKRMWLGVLNEQGTHIVGQAGFGPGVRKRIEQLQIELDLDHGLLDEAIEKKRPVVVSSQTTGKCSGLERIIERLHPGPFVIVPLVSIGQVVGILIIEPTVGAGFFTPARLSFLNSMAAEIAAIFIAHRFESKVAEAGKMRMAGLFASGVAHNFNNMLQAILGQASLMEMQLDKDSQYFDAIRVIKNAATRGAGLVKQLLSFSLSDSHKKVQKSLAALITDSEDLYRSILGSGISLVIDIVNKDHLAMIDANQIQQVITNLLMNAKESMPEGGKVTVHCKKVRLRSGEIDPELSPGEYIRVEVQDTGVGMTDEMMSRCFEPFYTTKNVDAVTGIGITGSGLGLSTAYSIVKQHGGLITVQSEEGEGTALSVYLPALKSAGEVEHLAISEPRAIILSLDSTQLLVAQAALHSWNIASVVCRDEKEFLAEHRKHENIKLFLIDADRFKGNISKTILAIREKYEDATIVVHSFSIELWKRKLEEYLDYLKFYEKPVDTWELESIVHSVFGVGKGALHSKVEVEITANKGEGSKRQSHNSDEKRMLHEETE